MARKVNALAVTIRLPLEVHKRVKLVAVEQNCPIKQIVLRALLEWMERNVAHAEAE